MRVARLELTGVGPFEGAVFAIPEPTGGPGELVLFEGPNGCGKTTIVQTIAVMLSGPWKGGEGLEDVAERMGDYPWLCTRPPVASLLRRLREPKVAARAVGCITDKDDFVKVDIHPEPPGGRVMRVAGTPRRLAKLDHFGSWVEHDEPVEWAAFAYEAHQESAELATLGPRTIEVAPLSGALSFGKHMPESKLLGQLLVNLENDRTKAVRRKAPAPDASPRPLWRIGSRPGVDVRQKAV